MDSEHTDEAVHAERLERVDLALTGLSVGDAFGECFFDADVWDRCLASQTLPPSPWPYTDDTTLALAIRETLRRCGRIDQDVLCREFATRYAREPHRGYGAGSHALLSQLAQGGDWRELAPALFRGEGSMGNGAAMRVAPLGAYFADDLRQAAIQARLSAEVTHAHDEGIAGAVAVAVAAAWSWQWRRDGRRQSPRELFDAATEHMDKGQTRDGIRRVARFPLGAAPDDVAREVGNGGRVTAQDTVPFCLWSAAANLQDFPRALWNTVHVAGDIDTNCASVGGIVVLAVGREGTPTSWLQARESLPD